MRDEIDSAAELSDHFNVMRLVAWLVLVPVPSFSFLFFCCGYLAVTHLFRSLPSSCHSLHFPSALSGRWAVAAHARLETAGHYLWFT